VGAQPVVGLQHHVGDTHGPVLPHKVEEVAQAVGGIPAGRRGVAWAGWVIARERVGAT